MRALLLLRSAVGLYQLHLLQDLVPVSAILLLGLPVPPPQCNSTHSAKDQHRMVQPRLQGTRAPVAQHHQDIKQRWGMLVHLHRCSRSIQHSGVCACHLTAHSVPVHLSLIHI